MADSFVFSNRAVSVLQSGIDQFGTVAHIGADDVDRFPVLLGGAKFPIILSDREDEWEIAYVISLTETGEMVLERAREGTGARNWSSGTYVEHCLTAGTFLSAARFVPKGTWSAATNYIPGDVVVYTGISYIAAAASLNQVPSGVSPYWQVLYQPPGISSTALNWSGDWNSGTTYALGAYVKYNGRLWVAVAAGSNHLPTDPAWWYPLGVAPDPTYHDGVLTTTGAVNNYVVNPSPAPAALYDNMALTIVFTNPNTTATTLTIGALAPTPLRAKKGVDFLTGEIIANVPYQFIYFAGTNEFVAKGTPVFEKRAADNATLNATQDARLTAIENYIKYVPVGSSVDYWGDVPDPGWLFMYGQAISQVTYSALFAKLSTKYNTGGEPGGTFRVPDARGRVTAGQDDMGGVSANRLTSPIDGDVLGAVGGAESHVLTIAQMPSHDHTGSALLAGAHNHTYEDDDMKGGATVGSSGVLAPSSDNRTTSTAGNHTHVLSINNTGGDGAHPNVQPTIICNKIIFTGVP